MLSTPLSMPLSASDGSSVVRLPGASPRWEFDGVLGLGLGVALVSTMAWVVKAPSSAGLVVLVGLAVLAFGFAMRFGQSWVIDGSSVCHRRLLYRSTIAFSELRAVTTRRDEMHQGDIVLLGRRWSAITIPAELLTTNPTFARALTQGVAHLAPVRLAGLRAVLNSEADAPRLISERRAA